MCSSKQVDMKDIANLQENSSDGVFSDRGAGLEFGTLSKTDAAVCRCSSKKVFLKISH